MLRHVQMGLRKLKSYMVCINTKCPGRECGFCGIFGCFSSREISSRVMKCMLILAAMLFCRASTLC